GRRRIVTGGLSGRRPTKKSAPRIISKCSTTAYRSRTSRISKSPLRPARPAGQAQRRRSSRWRSKMSWLTWRGRVLAGSILAGLTGAAPVPSAIAQDKAVAPDFSSNFAGWVGFNGGGPFFEPVPGSRMPGPIVSDPRYPFVPNGAGFGVQPTYRIPDLTNPNLKPWVKEHMRKDTAEILAGKKPAFTAQSSCWPSGVPFFMGYGGPDPLVFIQTPKQVRIMWREDNQYRQVAMDVP